MTIGNLFPPPFLCIYMCKYIFIFFLLYKLDCSICMFLWLDFVQLRYVMKLSPCHCTGYLFPSNITETLVLRAPYILFNHLPVFTVAQWKIGRSLYIGLCAHVQDFLEAEFLETELIGQKGMPILHFERTLPKLPLWKASKEFLSHGTSNYEHTF